MASHVLVTYNHKTDETTRDLFNGLEEARLQAARLAGEVMDLNPGITSHPTEINFVANPRHRQITVIDKTGKAWLTYRVNDNERHCRTCRCNVQAFG